MRTRILLAAALLAGCQTTQSTVQDLTATNQCEKAAEVIANGFTPGNSAVEASKTGAAYAITGAGYAADTIVAASSGVIIFTLTCGPVIALSTIANAHGRLHCIDPGDNGIFSLFWPGWGEDAGEATAEWRLSEAENKSRSLRKLAHCYEKRNDEPNLIKAYTQVDQVLTAPQFASVSPQEKSHLGADKARIESKLLKLNSEFVADIAAAKAKHEQQVAEQSAAAKEDLQKQIKSNKTWRQLSEGRRWIYSDQNLSHQSSAKAACESLDQKYVWRLPSARDLKKAGEEGLFDAEKNTAFGARANERKVFWMMDQTSLMTDPATIGLLCIR